MTCPKCGAHVVEQARFCPQCGTQLSKARVKRKCAHCGAEVAALVAVCPECGQSLKGASPYRLPLRPRPLLLRVAGGALVVGLGALLLVSVFRGGLRLPAAADQPRLTATSPVLVKVEEPSTQAPTDTPAATVEPTQPPTEAPTEPPATETPAPPPATPAPVTHVIKSGESLRSIAEQYQISLEELAAANNMKASDLILVGQELKIPGQNPQPAPDQAPPASAPDQAPPEPGPATYVVQKGDNLLSIALKNNTTVAALMAENGIRDADTLQLGQELKIPGRPTVQPTEAPTEAPTATPPPTELPATVAATAAPATLMPSTASEGTPAPAHGGFEFAAPHLLSPADGAKQVAGEEVLLNWSSVGLLGNDTWYVIKIWRDDPSLPTPPAGWTRTTAWRIPLSYQPAANAPSHVFHWSVTVMRVHEGEAPVPVSQASDSRTFTW